MKYYGCMKIVTSTPGKFDMVLEYVFAEKPAYKTSVILKTEEELEAMDCKYAVLVNGKYRRYKSLKRALYMFNQTI